jgi:hypothetical protein
MGAPPRSHHGAGIEIYSQDPAYLVAAVGNYLIQILKGRMTTSTVSVMRRCVSDLSERHGKFGYFAITEPTADLLMAADIRKGMADMVQRYSRHMTGAAIVYEKPGFQATALRSIITAVSIAARSSHPTKVFAELEQGVSWLNGLTPGETTAVGLLRSVKQLRASL